MRSTAVIWVKPYFHVEIATGMRLATSIWVTSAIFIKIGQFLPVSSAVLSAYSCSSFHTTNKTALKCNGTDTNESVTVQDDEHYQS